MKDLSKCRAQLSAALVFCAAASLAQAAEIEAAKSVYRGVNPIAKFDVSPPLRLMTPLPVPDMRLRAGEMQDDKLSHLAVPFGYQDYDPIVQSQVYPPRIPAPIVSFDAQGNLSGVSPPDPVGDVGPNHYVAMSNLSIQMFNKSGVSVFGPALTNTLWSGFGGACQTENSGDPIVLHDQFADRWIITQFTSAGPTFYNCVALSTSPDPTGTYYRYAISTGGNFPDYPKYGVWTNAYVISTREFLGSGGAFQGVGAYALDRAQMLVGNPSPTVISFLATPSPAYNVGDGLLPADIDGTTLPPAGAPAYFVGSMDNGGSYGAPQDALTLWKFTINFSTPASSSFVLANTIPIAPYDTVFPCSGRSCIPQSGTTNRLDILSYRQRPMNRLAYRNFGSHESLVTNQSVEATTGIAGIRWWEIRSPNITPILYQEGTYAPDDGLHRWMGSIAMDSSGNMALGYSTSSATTFPSIAYTGRLVSDPLNSLPQGEQYIIAGTGSQTGSQRWGDYTSMNLDPTDDCTFWFVNQYLPTTSGNWRLRVGSFRYAECGSPTFTLSINNADQHICAGTSASFPITTNSIAGFTNPVSLALAGLPSPASASFTPNPVTTPGTSTLSIGNTSSVASGTYALTINGTAAGSDPRSVNAQLRVYSAVPALPTLTTPANGATNQNLRPGFLWTGSNAQTYTLEVASDAGFSNIVFTTTISTTSVAPTTDLANDTTYYWRVRSTNSCGNGSYSAVFSFRTVPAPGACAANTSASTVFSENFTTGVGGFTTTGSTGTSTWALSTARPSLQSGGNAMKATDIATASSQVLTSPTIVLPANQLPLSLNFQNWREMEINGTAACYDGGFLEISVNGGAFAQIPPARILNDPYRGAVNGGPQGWCNDPARPYSNPGTTVDLNDWAGNSVQLRWRLTTDGSLGREGWYVDDIRVQSCSADRIFANGFDSTP